ncbi:MAG: hypothetical protein IPL52_00490 [Flavobacteriales bacterium]|nr:hypothetical protein [Flavobacteriales bacterium]
MTSDMGASLEKVKPLLRPLLDALLDLVQVFPAVRVEHASGSFMVKAPATFCSFRPRAEDIQVSFILDREVDVFPISKRLRLSAHRVAHSVHVDDSAAIDQQLRSWIQEAYTLSREIHRGTTH